MELAAPIALWKVYNGKVVSGGLCFAAMFAATISSASRMGVILVLAEFLVALMLLVVGAQDAAEIGRVPGGDTRVAGGSRFSGGGNRENLGPASRKPIPTRCAGTLLASTLKMIPLHPVAGIGHRNMAVGISRVRDLRLGSLRQRGAQRLGAVGVRRRIAVLSADGGVGRLAGEAVPPIGLGAGSPKRDDSQLHGLSAAGSCAGFPLVYAGGGVDADAEHTAKTPFGELVAHRARYLNKGSA